MDLKIFIPASPPLPFFLLAAMVHVARIVAIDHISINPDAAAGDHPDVAGTTMEFFMHDILGGSSPTARPIAGLLGSIYSSQVPFALPVGFTTPRGGVPIPNANGAIPTINGNNGIPYALAYQVPHSLSLLTGPPLMSKGNWALMIWGWDLVQSQSSMIC